MSVNKYRVYCNDEATTVEGWLDAEPTTCFNNNAHTIDTKQTVLVSSVPPQDVRIVQTRDGEDKASHYFMISKSMAIAGNETKEMIFNIPIASNLFSVKITTSASSKGDSYDTYMNKDTLIGGVTQSDTKTTEVQVSQTVVDNAVKGFHMKFGDGNYVRIVSIGESSVTVDEAVDVTIGDLVYMSYFMILNKTVTDNTAETYGESIVGSFHIDAGTVAGITYRNSNSSIKRITIDMETTFYV